MESLSICPYHEINGQIDKLNDYSTNKGKEDERHRNKRLSVMERIRRRNSSKRTLILQ